jgi:hypothetical protein
VLKTGLIRYSSSTTWIEGEKHSEAKRVESPIPPWIVAFIVAPLGVVLILGGTPVGESFSGAAAAILASWAIGRDIAEYGFSAALFLYGLGAVPYGIYRGDRERVSSGLVVLALFGVLIGLDIVLIHFFSWARKDLDGFLDPYRTLAHLF